MVHTKDTTACIQYMQTYEKPYRLHADGHPVLIKRFKAE